MQFVQRNYYLGAVQSCKHFKGHTKSTRGGGGDGAVVKGVSNVQLLLLNKMLMFNLL